MPPTLQQRGMTLLEIMMALGLSALVLVAVVSFYTDYTNRLLQLSDKAENAADLESGEQIMLKDLKAVDPSFGTLTVTDDTGRGFFDYYPDVPESSLDHDPVCGASCRTYTMQQGDATKGTNGFAEISLLVSDSSAHILPSMIYDPTWAEAMHQCVAPCLSSGQPPTYKTTGVYGDSTQIVTARGPLSHYSGSVQVNDYPGYWNPGQVLMLDTPTGFRPEGATDWAHNPPRPTFFLGFVVNGGTDTTFSAIGTNAFDTKNFAGSADQSTLLNIAHPVYANTSVSDPHTFFMNLPPIGGGQPMVRLRPVRIVRYTLEPMFPSINPALPPAEQAKRQGAMRLWRQTYYKGAWNNSRGRSIIAEWVKSVQLRRSTVTSKAISFSISKYEAKKGGIP
jgi:prepilin-type N-terminal cleavage/methylation domain-containing protein